MVPPDFLQLGLYAVVLAAGWIMRHKGVLKPTAPLPLPLPAPAPTPAPTPGPAPTPAPVPVLPAPWADLVRELALLLQELRATRGNGDNFPLGPTKINHG